MYLLSNNNKLSGLNMVTNLVSFMRVLNLFFSMAYFVMGNYIANQYVFCLNIHLHIFLITVLLL